MAQQGIQDSLAHSGLMHGHSITTSSSFECCQAVGPLRKRTNGETCSDSSQWTSHCSNLWQHGRESTDISMGTSNGQPPLPFYTSPGGSDFLL